MKQLMRMTRRKRCGDPEADPWCRRRADREPAGAARVRRRHRDDDRPRRLCPVQHRGTLGEKSRNHPRVIVRKLVYASQRKETGEQDVEAILGPARSFNRAQGITGILLFDDRRFLQLLEGEHDPIARCFLRIAASRLHGDIEIATFEESAIRLFAGWDMRAVDAGRSNVSLSAFWRRVMRAPVAARLEMVEDFVMRQHGCAS